jgi:hypothetical protein
VQRSGTLRFLLNQEMNMREEYYRIIRIVFLTTLVVLPMIVAVPNQVFAATTGWIVVCNYSHSLSDDPIVFPGQPGAAHLHDFIGALKTDAFSTATSLRVGGTSCLMPADSSSYWSPALYKNGVRITPKNTAFYYRRKGAPAGTMVQPFPEGLRMLIGNGHAMSPEENPQLGTEIIFKCGPGGSAPDLPVPPTQCSTGVMVVSLVFPNCWDGKNLDSADHHSHMAYPSSGKCPATHPVVLPRLETFYRYTVGTAPIGTITFSSGPYYTIHQDYFNGWEPKALQTLVANCLNKPMDCGKNPTVSSDSTVSFGEEDLGDDTPNTLYLPAITLGGMHESHPHASSEHSHH